ncbi:MAG: LON peptidase substrate-binding domain-containing protein [Actinobacteria bacterium]|nr:LON peptidase substrate-binding domain-containing protein [Actinomycetota bacterium]
MGGRDRVVGTHDELSELGLFPLGIVLLPSQRIPLHIFEPRYRELIGECLAEERAFGVVLADDAGLRSVGTRAKIVEVLERFEDGRLNVVVEGGERFRLLELTEGRSFHTARVDPFEEEAEPASGEDRERALARFHELRGLVGSDVDEPDEDTLLSFALAARVDFGPEAKQELLEIPSERRRLALVTRLLARALARIHLERQRREIASRNGSPRG